MMEYVCLFPIQLKSMLTYRQKPSHFSHDSNLAQIVQPMNQFRFCKTLLMNLGTGVPHRCTTYRAYQGMLEIGLSQQSSAERHTAQTYISGYGVSQSDTFNQ